MRSGRWKVRSGIESPLLRGRSLKWGRSSLGRLFIDRGGRWRQSLCRQERMQVVTAEQVAGNAGGDGGVNVAVSGADEIASAPVDRPFPSGAEQHTWVRLPVGVCTAVGLYLALG